MWILLITAECLMLISLVSYVRVVEPKGSPHHFVLSKLIIFQRQLCVRWSTERHCHSLLLWCSWRRHTVVPAASWFCKLSRLWQGRKRREELRGWRQQRPSPPAAAAGALSASSSEWERVTNPQVLHLLKSWCSLSYVTEGAKTPTQTGNSFLHVGSEREGDIWALKWRKSNFTTQTTTYALAALPERGVGDGPKRLRSTDSPARCALCRLDRWVIHSSSSPLSSSSCAAAWPVSSMLVSGRTQVETLNTKLSPLRSSPASPSPPLNRDSMASSMVVCVFKAFELSAQLNPISWNKTIPSCKR